MKLFSGLLLSAIFAVILLAATKWTVHLFDLGDLAGYIWVIIGNSIFSLLLIFYVLIMKDVALFNGRAFLDVVIFLIFISSLAIVGAILYASLGSGVELLLLIETIGYYPSSGPDYPMEFGILIWLLTCLLPIYIALSIGLGVRSLKIRKDHSG